MYYLRLFHRNDPDHQIECRLIKSGELTVGRDPGVGWRVNDPARAISRSHCIFSLTDGRLTVRDISSNGTFLGAEGQPAPKGEAVPIRSGVSIRVGDFNILVEEAEHAAAGDGGDMEGFSHAAGLSPGSSPFAPPAKPTEEPPRRAADEIDVDRTFIGARLDPAAARSAGAKGGASLEAPFVRPILETPQVQATDIAVPDDWETPPAAGAPASRPAAAADPTADELFQAFCAGARLHPSAFAREDRVELMHNLGAVYQQMLLGLGDLLSERTSVKSEYRMERTTVRPEGNNPFKWSPPARVAVDLLRPNDDGFLSGPSAVKESFEDLKKHLLCVLAGLRAALSSTLEALRPDTVESRVSAGAGLFGGSKEARAWAEYRKLYADLKKQADDNPDSQINRDFRAGYEKQLAALDSLKPPR